MLAREVGIPLDFGPVVTEPAPGLYLSESRGNAFYVLQVVALLPSEADAEARLAETARANSSQAERASIPSPGPPGSVAFAMHLEYSGPVAQSPLVMVAARRGRYVVRVEAQRLTQPDALDLAGRLIRRLLDRAQ